MSNKKALVLGARGQDGALICKSLLRKNYEVIGLSKQNSSPSESLKKIGIEKEVDLQVGDVKDEAIIKNIIVKYQPEEIYNLAGQSSVGKSFLIPKETAESIITGTLNILEVAKFLNFKGRIFFAGSSEMFGSTEKGADVNCSQNPISPYAISKQTSFKLVKLYRENFNLNCVTGVLFNHESNLRNSNFVTHKIIEGAIIAKKNKNHKLKLGNINIIRDWGWAEEYVEAMQIILNYGENKDHVICTGRSTSLLEFLNITFSKLNLKWKDHVIIDESLKRKNEISKSFGDPNPLDQQLKWKATVCIDEIITKLLEEKIKDSFSS